MMPVWQEVNSSALKPYLHEEISQEAALKAAITPIRNLCFNRHEKRFISVCKNGQGRETEQYKGGACIHSNSFIRYKRIENSLYYRISFICSLLIIDMVVASVLLSMGMMMLPPILISLPFKLMLFVLIDGWHLIVGSLVKSFIGG